MSRKWYGNKVRKLEKSASILKEVEYLYSHPDMPNHSKEFLGSLADYYKQNGGLTIRQYKALVNVATQIEPEQIIKRKRWSESYSEEQREVAKICALYYVHTPYFSSLAKRILKEEDFIPSEEAFTSMCYNRYAQKIIEATCAEPKYDVGTLVKFRKTNSSKIPATYATGKIILDWENYRDKTYLVVSVNSSPVISPAKGGKKYNILPFGSRDILQTEERYLKKHRNSS